MDFHYTLLENGLDFVNSALDHLTAAQVTSQEGDPKRHQKYALIHLCSGVELILKERLRREDWKLVFQDREKATEGAYESGDFASVNFKTLQDRLEEDCGIELTPKQKADLTSFRKRRNRVEHFNALETLMAMQASTAQMVSFLIDFVGENFESEDFEDVEDELLAQIRSKLGACEAVVQSRLGLIQSEVTALYSVIQCPSCMQKAMSADGGVVKCLFCHHAPSPSVAVEEYVTSILGCPDSFTLAKDGGEWPVKTCPECGDDTFVTAVPGPADTYDFYCFNCGYEAKEHQMSLCCDCSEYFDHGDEPGIGICPDCFHAKVSRDD